MTVTTTATAAKKPNGNGGKPNGKTNGIGDLTEVLDAMRDLQSEADRWHLAEVLVAKVPEGVKGFGDILDRATKEGVAGNLSINTLRLYRDTAKRWPADKRVKNVNFTAHREAMAVSNTDEARKVLVGIAKQHGAGGVTAARVRGAVQASKGKQPAARKGAASSAATPKAIDVLRDLAAGGTQLIDAIGTSTEPSMLDKLQTGLTKVLAHVEKERAKVARKAASAKAKPAAAPVKRTGKAAPAKGVKKAGDLRGM